ncbi:MAG: radical SAM protein [Armatimonadota bacterium]
MIERLADTEQGAWDLAWVAGFIDSIRQYIHVREEDGLLIVVPNQAHRLNATGLHILKCLLDGETMASLLEQAGDTSERRRDIHYFLCDVRALVMGCLHEGQRREGVETVPYEGSFNVLPVLSELAVTYRCNLRCAFCYASCNCTSREAPDGEMSTAEAKRVIERIRREADVPSISFTGGEPMLRDDLCELIALARELGMRVNLITNGTLITPDSAEALVASGLNSAQVSLEGGSADVHDALTRQPGSFDATCAGIRHLQRTGIHVHTNTTVSRGNIDCVEQVVDCVAGMGLDRLSMNMVIPCGSALESPEQVWVRYDEIGPAVLRVRQRAREQRGPRVLSGVEFMWYSPTPYCLFNPIAEGLGNKGCAACDGLLSVAPNGDVLPCSSFEQGVGNLLEHDFRSIWDSPGAEYHKRNEHAPAVCRRCEHFHICNGACPLYWQAMGEDELAADMCSPAGVQRDTV